MGLVVTPKNCDVSVKKAIQQLSRQLDSQSFYNFTASRLVATNATQRPISVSNLTDWIAGTTNQITVTDDSDGTITLSTPQDIHTGATPTFAGLISTGVVQATGFAKTGWPVSPGVTLSFGGTRTVTVTDGGSAYYYINGVKYVLGGNKTVQIDDTEGLWYIYFDGSTLTASQTPWVITDDDKALVCLLYWDATNSKEILFGYELHNYIMDAATHSRLHHAGGSAWGNGLLVSDAGSELINVSAGEFHDEDIEIAVSDGAGAGLFEQVLSPAEIPIYYRSGASAWRIYETTDKANATDSGYVSGSNELHYNKLNGTWASTYVGAAKYVAYYILAVNDQTEPVVAIMGQRIDTTLATAKANNIFSGMSLSGWPFEEAIILARVILKQSGSGLYYTLEDVTDLRYANQVGNVTSPLISDHGGLGGLADDDHAQYLLADGTRALAGAWDMGSQALTNVNIDSGVITGITDLAIADGGTGQSTAQTAINALTAVSGATNEHVLTKDTATGNAVFKVAAGGTDKYVGIDAASTPSYLGPNSNDGVLRTGTSLSYTDGGDFVTLNTIQDLRTTDSPTFNALTLTNHSTEPQLLLQSNYIGSAEVRTHSSAGAGYAAFLSYRRSRGTAASPSACSAGDILGIFNAIGYTNGWVTAARIEMGCDTGWGATGADGPGYFYFKTTPDGSDTPTTKLSIKQNGYIGLGTESPADHLHIYGAGPQIRQERTGTGGAVWTTGVSYADASNYGSLYFTTNNAASQIYFRDSSSVVTLGIDTDSGLVYPGGAGTQNLGDASNYWADISYKTLTDRGCLGCFDDGVELQDGTIVSDIDAICAMTKREDNKNTVYGVPMLDYRNMPKAVYKPASKRDGTLYKRDSNNEPIPIEIRHNHIKEPDKITTVQPQDGAEMSALISIMIGAIKELKAEIDRLKG